MCSIVPYTFDFLEPEKENAKILRKGSCMSEIHKSVNALEALGETTGDEHIVTPHDIRFLTLGIIVRASEQDFAFQDTVKKLETLLEALGKAQFEVEGDESKQINQSYRELSAFLDGIKFVSIAHNLNQHLRS